MYLRILLCTILIFLIVLIAIAQFTVKYPKNKISTENDKNLEAFHNYSKCIKNGFTREYCLINPETHDNCICENGTLGKFDKRGKCICLEKDVKNIVINEPISLYPDVFN